MYLDYCFIVILLVLFECIDIKSNFFILLLLPCNICIVLNLVIFVTTNILWIFIPISIWFSSLFVHCCHLALSFSHFNIFLRNHRSKLNQTRRKCYLGGTWDFCWISFHLEFQHDSVKPFILSDWLILHIFSQEPHVWLNFYNVGMFLTWPSTKFVLIFC